VARQSGSSKGVPRRILRYSLIASLLAATVFAAWSWFRPYAWSSDAAARCDVVEVLVTRDQSFYWLNVHLKVNPGMSHDLEKRVRLEVSPEVYLEPADTTLVGKDGQAIDEIWFKFWLESAQLKGPLALHLNDGKLSIKSTSGMPDLGSPGYRNFVTNQW
jgi:hypothetical protein